jgi:hypothetical protein
VNLASEGVHAFALKTPSSFMEMFPPYSRKKAYVSKEKREFPKGKT